MNIGPILSVRLNAFINLTFGLSFPLGKKKKEYFMHHPTSFFRLFLNERISNFVFNRSRPNKDVLFIWVIHNFVGTRVLKRNRQSVMNNYDQRIQTFINKHSFLTQNIISPNVHGQYPLPSFILICLLDNKERRKKEEDGKERKYGWLISSSIHN